MRVLKASGWLLLAISLTVMVCCGYAAAQEQLADGSYTATVTMEGGTGKASIESPATITVEDGVITAAITWSSSHYDYMIVDGETYLPVNTGGNSAFEIPVSALETPITVIGDTTAMSVPHEIEYTLTFALVAERDAAGWVILGAAGAFLGLELLFLLAYGVKKGAAR